MTYHPLRLKGLLFELEYDPLPNCTMRSSNSFEWRKIIFGMIASMGIRHAKTLTLRGKVFDETRAKIRLIQVNHPRYPSLSKFSRQDRERGIQFLESSLKTWDTPMITGICDRPRYPRLGNPEISIRTLRSLQSLIVSIFAQSVAPSVGPATISPVSTKYQILTPVFAATTPENTPFAYRASTLANLNPMISLAFVEANYEDYDEEREMEPRPGITREATPSLRPRSPGVRR
ncbi:hypothetical protein Tco_0912226 [Tanacetum coccineum]